MTYSEAIEFLYGLRWFGAKLGLDNTFRLAELAGNPQQRLRFIHVAGTNGKGSTCAMLDSIYRASGLRVGLFTSPHLVAFGERIQVNRRPIPDEDVARLTLVLAEHLRQFSQEHHPTFFEVITVMALMYFAEQGCDLVVWETGLGGRLDATNIITPLVSVITNIQYDHQKWLGETLASIASEKAGIIKSGVPVVTGVRASEALGVIAETAREKNAPLTCVPLEAAEQPPLDSIELPLLGHHQRRNAAVALGVVETLRATLPLSSESVVRGLSKVHWAGRLQVVRRSPGQTFLLDGAHNVGGAEMLAEALQKYFPGLKPALILGILRDKDWQRMCEILAPLANRILLVPVHSERTAEPHGLAESCRSANPKAQVLEQPSVDAALESTANDPFIVLAGSLYLVGEAMERLHISAARPHERELNEWKG